MQAFAYSLDWITCLWLGANSCSIFSELHSSEILNFRTTVNLPRAELGDSSYLRHLIPLCPGNPLNQSSPSTVSDSLPDIIPLLLPAPGQAEKSSQARLRVWRPQRRRDHLFMTESSSHGFSASFWQNLLAEKPGQCYKK